jgi:hypothetical protein
MGRSPHNSQDNAIDKSVFRSGEGDTDPNLLVRSEFYSDSQEPILLEQALSLSRWARGVLS